MARKKPIESSVTARKNPKPKIPKTASKRDGSKPSRRSTRIRNLNLWQTGCLVTLMSLQFFAYLFLWHAYLIFFLLYFVFQMPCTDMFIFIIFAIWIFYDYVTQFAKKLKVFLNNLWIYNSVRCKLLYLICQTTYVASLISQYGK